MHAREDARRTTLARRRETLEVCALLVVLLVLFFSQPLLTGQKLLPADIAYSDPVFLGHAPSGLVQPHNVLLYDQAYQFYPWRVYASEAIHQGSLPFWNPEIYCGVPFLAADQPAVFYPLNLVSYALAPADALLFTAFLRLFVAGLATYWFVRTIGGGRFGALVSSISFAFSGFMVVWLGHPHANVAAWLPSLFLTLEWLVRRASRRHIALVALVLGTQLTGGHAETALYTLTAGGLYYFFRVLTEAQGHSRRLSKSRLLANHLLAFAVAAALGFGLALVQLVPFWQWLRQSAELQFRVGAGGLRVSRLGPRYWLAGLLPLVLPNVFGNPTWPGEYRSFFSGWNYVEQTVYVGVVGLALAVVAVMVRLGRAVQRWRADDPAELVGDRQVLFHATLATLALGAALRVPVFDWVNHLPLFSIAAYGRLRLITTFCLSVLAGYGARDLFDRTGRHRAVGIAVRAVLGLGLIGVLIWAAAPGTLSRLALEAKPSHVQQMLQQGIREAYRISNVRMYWPVLAAVAFGCVLVRLRSRLNNAPDVREDKTGRRTRSRRACQATILSLVIVDMFMLGRGYHTVVPAEDAFPVTPALQLLQSDPGIFRIAGTNVDLMPNTCMIYGLQDIRGLDFPIERYRDLSLAIGARDWLGYGLLLADQLQPRLLGMLNVKYVLSSERLDAATRADLRLVAEDGEIGVYENLALLPRAFVVHQVRVETHPANALQVIVSADFEPASEIVLERAPPQMLELGVQSADSAPSSARITDYQANRVTVEAEAASDGFLFLSDTFYPDWKAYVDGLPTDIYRADYAFRAVPLRSGRHKVEFVYEPDYFRLAAVGTSLAMSATLALLFADWIAARRCSASWCEGSVGKPA